MSWLKHWEVHKIFYFFYFSSSNSWNKLYLNPNVLNQNIIEVELQLDFFILLCSCIVRILTLKYIIIIDPWFITINLVKGFNKLLAWFLKIQFLSFFYLDQYKFALAKYRHINIFRLLLIFKVLVWISKKRSSSLSEPLSSRVLSNILTHSSLYLC